MQSDNSENAIKNQIDYTATANRLRSVSLYKYNHPNGVVNRFMGKAFPIPERVV